MKRHTSSRPYHRPRPPARRSPAKVERLPLGTVLEHPCPDCEAPMVLRDSRFGLFYGCINWPVCKGTHGAHRATGKPLGVPADRPTRQARIEAHAAFDRVWQTDEMTRGAAYSWMWEALGLSHDAAHIGNFDLQTCRRLVAAVEARWPELAK